MTGSEMDDTKDLSFVSWKTHKNLELRFAWEKLVDICLLVFYENFVYKKRFLVLISGLFLTQKHKKSHDIAPLIHRANRMLTFNLNILFCF